MLSTVKNTAIMSQPTQTDIFAALQAQGSFRSKNPKKTVLLSSIVGDVKEELTSTTTIDAGEAKNHRKIYCLREGCGSCILSQGAGRWLESTARILPEDLSSPFPPLSNTSEPQPKAYWYIPESPFAFDNIGFSRPDQSVQIPLDTPGLSTAPPNNTSTDKGKPMIKWLICAECDLGPLGWSFEGGKESWLAVDRVRYGVD